MSADKKVREFSPEDKRQLEMMRYLQDLTNYAPWKEYKKILQEFTQSFHMSVLKPVSSVDDTYASEYAKGAVYGLTLAMNQVDTIIKTVKDTVLANAEESE